jgi:cell wall-associated NlpC family hydrolase
MWSGLRGASITGSLRDLIGGKKPAAGTDPITGTSPAGGTGTGGSASGSAIAQDAMRYEGCKYSYGAANPPVSTDCSGLVNAVIGRDLGMAIPGYASGKYSGHGPVTGQWFAWNGCITVPASEMQAGDLVCWLSHMGIVTTPGQCISALNPQLGTLVQSISAVAPFGEPEKIRRIKA